jgi:membrane protease YdiL (CAAX protease family)
MVRNQGHSSLSGKVAWVQLLVSLFYVIIIGGGILLVLLIPGLLIFNPPDNLLRDKSLVPAMKDVGFLFYAMFSQHISIFIIPGFILIRKLNSNYRDRYPGFTRPDWSSVWSVMLLTICILPFAGVLNELALMIKVPELLSGFSEWITEKERLTERLFDSFFIYKSFLFVLLNIMMIVILPGVGEELIFRGVLQPVLGRLLKSPYAGVILTALLFSAGHIQLNGFIPRFMLGLACGLIFLWTGKLWLSVIIHSTNNALAIIGGYVVGPGHPANPEPGYQIILQILFMTLLLIPAVKILSSFRKQYSPVQQADYQVVEQRQKE